MKQEGKIRGRGLLGSSRKDLFERGSEGRPDPRYPDEQGNYQIPPRSK